MAYILSAQRDLGPAASTTYWEQYQTYLRTHRKSFPPGGAYHDHWIEFLYPRVFGYSLANLASAHGHYDWRYDEFRLSDGGNLIHEIEWAGPPGTGARWVIEADDVVFSAGPRVAA